MTRFETTLRRFAALFDGSAWLLMLPALLVLFFIDPPMAKTLLQWSAFFGVLAGMAVIISRIVFPSINLTMFVDRAETGDRAAAIVVAAVLFFVAMVIMAFVVWARPA